MQPADTGGAPESDRHFPESRRYGCCVPHLIAWGGGGPLDVSLNPSASVCAVCLSSMEMSTFQHELLSLISQQFRHLGEGGLKLERLLRGFGTSF